MSATIPLLLIASICFGVISIVIFFVHQNTRKRQAAAARANTRNDAAPVVLDLGGRLPSKRRRPCGRHGEGGGNCDDCEHKHEHGEHEHNHCQK
ncbi:hypothetical protein M2447_001406 [Ereboglobus sp. PH5-10]|uniref:hypothetical protein n=1 Tax=Ereboglobus sp. PH5-10 TaxID=2940629 RepID=UPI0024075E8E|nr:hypothetical protein [Ereboglobus sp. PH5-10]MDF9827314.1 hypothetical protein [Ereboglobus sp. PH5-10]